MKAGAEVDREMKSRVIDKKDTSEKETGRISELNDFYVSNGDLSLKNLLADDNAKVKTMTEELRGQWAIEEMTQAGRGSGGNSNFNAT